MRFALGCELSYQVRQPTTFILNIQPAQVEQHELRQEELTITPQVEVEDYVMPESTNRFVRFRAQPGDLRIAYDAEIGLVLHRADPATVDEMPISSLPFEVMSHLYPSRYCQSDMLGRLALAEFGRLAPGHARVTGICNWIYEHVAYLRGTSDIHTSAGDTLVERVGVCRDFAHLGVALCRALGIPARFVSAYAWGLEPPDFHAVVEAWLGGRWYLFDPTRQAVLDGMVRIGVGRDAAEVSFATYYGDAQSTGMKVHIAPTDGKVPPVERTTEAISISTM